MSKRLLMRATILALGAYVLLWPAPAQAQRIFVGTGGSRALFIGGLGGLGGPFWGGPGWGGWGGPYWRGYGPGWGSPLWGGGFGPGWGVPGFAGVSPWAGFAGPAIAPQPAVEPLITAGWNVGPGSNLGSASPRMRDARYDYSGGRPVRVLLTSTSMSAPSDSAMMEVVLPDARAEVFVQDTLTTQGGTIRRYVSPPLTPGPEYVYSIRARWRDARGKIQIREQNVTVRAGSEVRVDFTNTP